MTISVKLRRVIETLCAGDWIALYWQDVIVFEKNEQLTDGGNMWLAQQFNAIRIKNSGNGKKRACGHDGHPGNQ